MAQKWPVSSFNLNNLLRNKDKWHEATTGTSQACLSQQSIRMDTEDDPIILQEITENIVGATFNGYKLSILA